MRVIAGRAKGHRLAGPPSRATRPTSDLVRGAIFSALESMGADLSRALDLYAGSGALGIPALRPGGDRDPGVAGGARAGGRGQDHPGAGAQLARGGAGAAGRPDPGEDAEARRQRRLGLSLGGADLVAAVYPGRFDPVTLGHVELAQRAG